MQNLLLNMAIGKRVQLAKGLQHMWHETHQWGMAHIYGSEILRNAITVLIDRRDKLTNVKLIEVDYIRKC